LSGLVVQPAEAARHEAVGVQSPRNALLKEGSKSHRTDVRKLAELLRSNLLRPVYHGEHDVRTLKELARNLIVERVKAGLPAITKQV
jgi:hypothetical protein